MSLLNILTGKTAASAIANSKPLSRFTSTTYAQAGTSLANVVSEINTAAKAGADASNVSTNQLYAPIIAIRDEAIKAYPTEATNYNNLAQAAMGRVDAYANANLQGSNFSLFDIQKVGKEAIAAGVSDMSNNVKAIAPTLANTITAGGINALGTAGRSLDSLTSSAFGSATNAVAGKVSAINNAIADKVSGAIDKAKSLTGGIAKLPGAAVGKDSAPAATSGPSVSDIARAKVGYTNISKIAPPADARANTTDLIYQDYKLFVEGVQVPFESISISQSLGQLPRASVQIPPQAGLMDIARYYQPKVHIFYDDKNTGGERLAFWGHIIAVNYGYSKQQGFSTVMFECEHKNALLEQVTFEWSAGGAAHATQGGNLTDTDPNEATAQLNNFNSDLTMILAMQGITGARTLEKDKLDPANKEVIRADITKLDPRFKELEDRLIGMPSSIMNLWNQVKREVFANQKLNLIFSKVYLPLVEDGIAFFDRMSGHNYIERQIHGSRQQHCNDYPRPEANKYDTLLPPAFHQDIMSAANTQLMLNALNAQLGFSNEQMNFYELFYNFFYTIEYDMVTMASPAEVPVDPYSVVNLDDAKTWRSQKRMAIETVVKPQLPFYYSPLCNVVLPNMYHTVEVSQQEGTVPTRVTVMNTALSAASNNPTSLGVNYRAPHSIREAVAIGKQLLAGGTAGSIATLQETTSSSYSVPGKYELGRGIKHKKLMMPIWLSYFSAGHDAKRSSTADSEYPPQGSIEEKNLTDLRLAWIDRYGYSTQSTEGEDTGSAERAKYKDALNPYSRKSKVMAYERMLFAAADYDFTKEVIQSRTGTVQGIFNPYIIPGYPMDILDSSPNRPSFHALCSSVTHSITSRGAATSISFVAAVTYAELSNYFMNPVHPWLQTALKMVNVNRDELISKGSSISEDEADPPPKEDKVTKEVKSDFLDDFNKKTREDALKSLNSTDFGKKLSGMFGLAPQPEYDTNKGDVRAVSQTLLGNPRAKAAADMFYKGVLGVGAAYPNLIYNFEDGMPQALTRNNGEWNVGSPDHIPLPHGGEGNDNYTGVGNLRLVSRQIESRASIEEKFGLKFIDMTPSNYTGAQAGYVNEVLTNRTLLEPGASPFLDYPDIQDFVKTSLEG